MVRGREGGWFAIFLKINQSNVNTAQAVSCCGHRSIQVLHVLGSLCASAAARAAVLHNICLQRFCALAVLHLAEWYPAER